MREAIFDTSPLQYLHQLGLLEGVGALLDRAIVPEAVVSELDVGRARGLDLPLITEGPWFVVEKPVAASVLVLAAQLGPGEREVLALRDGHAPPTSGARGDC